MNDTLIKKKGKINKKKLLLFLLVVLFVVLNVIILLKQPIKNIYVKNNTIYTDQEIIELAELENYPSFLLSGKSAIKKRILKNQLIKQVNVKKGFKRTVVITITEYKVLFLKDNKYFLENKKEVLTDKINYNVPNLINNVPTNIYDKFIECLIATDNDILKMISEIKYDPNEIDSERFILSMNDGNYVYLTLSDFDKINSYKSIVKNIGDNVGIFYLDFGNYFEPSENIK